MKEISMRIHEEIDGTWGMYSTLGIVAILPDNLAAEMMLRVYAENTSAGIDTHLVLALGGRLV